METVDTQTASKVRRVVDVQVLADPPAHAFCHSYASDTVKYWQSVERELNRWVKDFEDFIRDHRSQDSVNLRVERVENDYCSQCGEPWESSYDAGVEYCANCGAVLLNQKEGGE